MRIKLLNTELGIGVCNAEDVPAWATKHGPAAEVAFFYFHQRDWIVLNEDNQNFELYKMVVENYEDFSDMSDDIIGQGANSVDGAGAAGTGEQAGSREDQEKKYTDVDVDRIVAGTKVTDVTLSNENIYDEIIKGTEALDDAEVPDVGRVLTVTPGVYRMMKKCPDIALDCDISAEQKLSGVIALLDGMEVVKIPKNRMPENFGFMIAHPVATVAPTKLEEYKVHQDPPGISGELIEGRIVYDAFVLDNKKKAIYYMENKAS